MRRTVALVSLLAIAAISGAEDVKKTATTLYAKLDRAQLHKDLKGFENAMRPYLLPGFREVDSSGKTWTFKESTDRMAQAFGFIDKVKTSTTNINSVSKKGNLAQIVLTGKMVATLKGPDGKIHILKSISKSQDTWKLVGSQWKYAQSKELSENTTLDGNPLPKS